MCGICGFISNKNLNINDLIEMNNVLAHRGPDDHGEEIYQLGTNLCVGFAQRRLAIMDLSEKGHQPMHSADKRVSVIFNGEIYNFRELKDEIRDYPFQSDCDTEVILAAYLKWGIDFVNRVNGMFAIALLDRYDNSIYLIRDRIGKKPLYYYKQDENNIVFGSELKAIVECPLFQQEVNKDIVGRYLYRQYITAPDTIYKNTYKLESGSILRIRESELKQYKYWDIARKYKEEKDNQIKDYDEAKDELKKLLKDAVSRRLSADVPIGAFLSGGYDSSLVCAVAQELSSEPVKTFSIGFYEEELNEAVYAKEVANHIGAEHEELYITEQDMFSVLDSIPVYYDEPFADPSQIPTMIVSELAKRSVSVVLSGDGGDELFGGYPIYSILQKVQKKALWGKAVHCIRSAPGIKELQFWEKMNIAERIASDDINKEAKTQTGIKTYIDVVNRILNEPVNNYYYEVESKYGEKRYDVTRMLLDMDTYLPEDILTKVDRASMKYALECRCPLLDKEILEFSLRLPVSFKVDGESKKILKDITHDYIPEKIMQRPKKGFCVPMDKWLRGVLREKLLDWTEEAYLKEQGIFDPEATQKFILDYFNTGDQGKWSGHNFSRICWSYFVFQQWYEKNRK
ncbi:MAG: asparagine synthase (glutamine-hydrolyzing) [Lachnospiraceae bacterium]|nr:asparagine synthase (glutamine-hydrolyzing) [Lachnospiraceae bacterium]